MAVSLKFNNFQNKSISLPSRSHPTTIRIEEELNKIKTSTSTSTTSCADNICNGLSQLVELHHFMDHLLVLPATQSLISLDPKATWVEEIMDSSMKLLDVCNIIRDIVFQMEEHVQDLQCALRKRNDHTGIDNSIANYNSFRKKTKKNAKELIMVLKQSQKVMGLVADPDNHHLTSLIRVLMEVAEVTISLFELLVIYISASDLKCNGWSLAVSKLIHKGAVACKEDEKYKGTMNELEAVDVSLLKILRNGVEQTPNNIMQMTLCRLEDMLAKMQRIESGLQCLFRVLVRTRASLLNIISL
ncbi:hypothetical protein CTI12_AA305000 [Artemisia annua]|uniref:DUF241 domain protein n=1 Tax=Artemisia annua TaxID=35608 RepID=A0A2U1LPZ3_ARTAN|nr:hypothetical protein CTI12_AA305000 [Artemisia annua]